MSSALGCAISIIGNVVVSLSLNIQRLAHKKLGDIDQNNQEDSSAVSDGCDDPPQGEKNYLKSGWWWTGILLMAVGEFGNFLAYAFAPASVVATLGTTGLIANVFFAPLILKERFRKLDLLGVIIAIAGGITVVISAQAEQPKLSPQEIVQAISQLTFKIYFGVAICTIVVLAYLSPTYGHKFILIDLGLVALFGGFTALSTKGVSSLLSLLFYKVVEYPIFWILLGILVFTAVMQVRFLNRSLAKFDSTRVIPCQFCTFTISTIVGSAILYRDFERMDSGTIATFIFGCLLTFLGVWITSSRGSESTTESSTNIGPVSASQRIRRTLNTVFTEETPLLDEAGLTVRPKSNRLQSSNAQSGPLLNYFISKAENSRHRGSFNNSAYSSSITNSLRVRPRGASAVSTSV